MGIFRKKQNREKSNGELSRTKANDRNIVLKDKSRFGQRSQVNENILRNGPDAGFAYYDEA